MYQKPSVPRSIGGVLDDTFRLYRASISKCWLPMLVFSVVSTGINYYNLRALPQITSQSGLLNLLRQQGSHPAAYWIGTLVLILLGLIVYGMVIQNIVSASRGVIPAFGDSLNKALRRAPALFLASLIFTIAVVVGFVLLIIPGFYVWTRLEFFMVPLFSESEGPCESLATSWRLVDGNWWRTSTIIFVMFVVIYVLSALMFLLGNGLGTLVGSAPVNPLQMIGKVYLVTIVVSGIVSIFTTPLVMAVFVAVYQDLQLRKGGGDLEARLGALPKA